ncbi:MAG TPA: glucoamylase family protein [Steroidobacteraceae bacterium]|nr:glucoamylase family protein [Steroidobacteraceae bacterium]
MSRVAPWDSEDILREELFSVERLEQYAEKLAVDQRVDRRRARRPSLRARLRQNAAVLLADYRTIALAVRGGYKVTPAAEWLLDNYHVIDAQIRRINEDLPSGFYRQLPKLAEGPLAGYPRVFGIAWAFVVHTDSHFDVDALRRFVAAYQRVQALSIGELWAVAITLRIVLVENLRRAATDIANGQEARQHADLVADRLLGVDGSTDPDALSDAYAAEQTPSAAFVVQVVKRLRDQDPDVTPALALLERRLAAQGLDSTSIVHLEHLRQGGSNVTIRNIITSMRLISDIDWSEFFESVSLVDVVLRSDGGFAAMDFATRNLYRSAIEGFARGSALDEIQIAAAAVAAAASGASISEREGESGYHLIAAGRLAFEAKIGYRAPLSWRPRRLVMRFGAGGYIGAVTALALIALGFALHTVGPSGGGWRLLLLGLAGAIPAVDIAVALVNRAVARGIHAAILPGLALREDIPPELRTLVVVPTLLTSIAAVEAQVDRLEIHYLASPHAQLYFALLTDWSDAAQERLPADEPLLRSAILGIGRLNARYRSAAGGDRFILLHRRRVWSKVQRRWMGWERKRGKLHELNRLLRGATNTTFMEIDGGPPNAPPGVRFVITLDADTRLPRETVRRLIGKLAHPLNRPRFDPAVGRVVEGYAVLQPRVSPSLPYASEGSLFQRLVSSASGIDPYAGAVSDVYQDLFGEGSYTGKGIYDVDAFEAALRGRAADGTLLSHDLFEGIFARAGLASDVEVIDEFPARYDVAAARQHRWARGDWQLLPWLFGRRHANRGESGRAALPLIGRWKIADNLRRTLSAPAVFFALLIGWTLPAHAAWRWTLLIFATIAVPILLPVIAEILPRRANVMPRSHFLALGVDLWRGARQIGLQFVMLPYQAALMSDAIARTLFRVFVSHRRLLEWVTAAQASLYERPGLARAYRRMSGGILLMIASVVLLGFFMHGSWWLVAPFLAIWLMGPAAAVWISRSPAVPDRLSLTAAQARELRHVARHTWRFFETFVTAEDQMLPPDNFQEEPRPALAHRTSPTNLGLYLLATTSARDFGWIGTEEAVERLEATIATMGRLQRCRGHFYNWYDTQDLRPLPPHYVSSVDSGNLAAHLVTLANALRDWQANPRSRRVTTAGIEDALGLAQNSWEALANPNIVQAGALDKLLGQLRTHLRGAERGGDGDGVASSVDAAAAQAAALTQAANRLVGEHPAGACEEMLFWLQAAERSIAAVRRELDRSPEAIAALEHRLSALVSIVLAMADGMDFAFLLDPQRRLLSIGYRVAEDTLDPSCYDLLASEARLASFFAIAKGEVPSRHWFKLGRPVTSVGCGAALLSWSGSMFEYLMPSLVMRAPRGSLLDETSRLIVGRQISYASALDVPWGISESAYNARDLDFTYQYSNFGVPGLGLKRGLSANLVIAPYATALAAMVRSTDAVDNLARLAALGALGRYGFYEALDYTPARVPKGQSVAIVRAYMAHHQGMTILAIANVIDDGIMRRRFHAEPCIQATELLLQERTPRDVSVVRPGFEENNVAPPADGAWLPAGRRLKMADSATPQVNLLSNGRYSVMLTAAGSGYSRWRDVAVNRWHEDGTRDDLGSYIFLRDLENSFVWSAGHQPTAVEADSSEVTFTEDRAQFTRRDGKITTALSVLVSTEDDAEVRHLSITNGGIWPRTIEVTSYCELALAPPATDRAHPAFSKLFVNTEYLPAFGALIATRRRRQAEEADIWVAHQSVIDGALGSAPEYETDRGRFIGRDREICPSPAAMDTGRLSGTVGTVLDPIFALRHRLRVAAGATAQIAFWTSAAPTRQGILDLIDRHRDANAFVRAGMLAWTQAQVQLLHLGITAEEASLFQRLAGHLLFADSSMRASSDAIRRANAAPAALWSQGISGDLPILLLRIDDVDHVGLAHQLLQAHEYWRMKRLAVDLVILNERDSTYVQDLQTALETVVRVSQSRRRIAADAIPGGVFVLRADIIPAQARAALAAVARVILAGRRGDLAEQLDRPRMPVVSLERLAPRVPPSMDQRIGGPAPGELEFFNGTGGFAANGREYVTLLGPGCSTPAPWINVVANADFGFQVAAGGSGFTWSVNSRERTLTPWSNDPVADRPGEAWYLKDEDTEELWGPTLLPIRDPHAYHCARHGQGYSRFEHESHGIATDLLQFVPLHDPIKISRLRIRNASTRHRRICVTAYVEWVLGVAREHSAPFIVTDWDGPSGALFARNTWDEVFGSRVAFADLGGRQTDWTADRREFLGRHGTLARPAALLRNVALSRRTGAALDPCAALRAYIELAPGAVVDVLFLLGDCVDVESARALIQRYRAANIDALLGAVTAFWDEVLGVVQVKTPDRAMDIVLNRWFLYQTIACRMWARSAFYQASGAYGFRDQLQDSMALCIARPGLARQHLLRAAGRQFVEGDVQHWWLPTTGQGVRTRITDDPLWLAYTTDHYVRTTGDAAVLEEIVPYIDGQALRPEEADAFFRPLIADQSATLFEHCACALDRSLAVGVHGVPLIGTGDWNDGMNRVGHLGRGESVWLGWFLYATLLAFAPRAEERGERERSVRWLAHASALRKAIDENAWDGAWYCRGYYDDGTALGSSASEECRIDSIAQSWSVISGAGCPPRPAFAMAAVERELIRTNDHLALLFTPPFDLTALDPGYVKAYPPGIRENGGQYTHAAAWSVIAFATLGQADRATELFAMLNPINRSATARDVERYKVEPYVVAADVYSVAPHVGQGGWTWYTGSAAWMYRAGIGSILGLQLQGDRLCLSPAIPARWPGFEIVFRHRSARYDIRVDQRARAGGGSGRPGHVQSIDVDGVALAPGETQIALLDDGQVHVVRVALAT